MVDEVKNKEENGIKLCCTCTDLINLRNMQNYGGYHEKEY